MDQELRQYLEEVQGRGSRDLYLPRRFTAASESGEVRLEEYRFRGVFREREPDLAGILKHPRLLVLAEPGGGKSVAARAAVREEIRQDRIPVLIELKEYRGDLPSLLKHATPAFLWEGRLTRPKAYILDGIDEIPADMLGSLSPELEALLSADRDASVIATSRQAFYVANRSAFPRLPAVYHILDFDDEDIRRYATLAGIDADAFIQAVEAADAREEIRNPFILSAVAERFKKTHRLSERRTENVAFMIDELIRSRPMINEHRQRRALRMLSVAMETSGRNELTEQEAMSVIRSAMRITEPETRTLLEELNASILNRTANGFAFQMRSYGEYLAAEELETAPLNRVRELAFVSYHTPADTWLNTISYLAELNPEVRDYFVQRHPIWMTHASPVVLSEEQRSTVAFSIINRLNNARQYFRADPRVKVTQLARFITPGVRAGLLEDLSSEDEAVCGNALVLLGILKHPDVVGLACAKVMDRTSSNDLRHCGLIALINAGNSTHGTELMKIAQETDSLHIEIVDAIGALADEAQIPSVLPLILATDAMLSATYYHFREFRSRQALTSALGYFVSHPDQFNAIRSSGYIEPILSLLPHYFDEEVKRLCADLIESLLTHHVFPEREGLIRHLIDYIREVDRDGDVARLVLEREATRGQQRQRAYHLAELVVSLMTVRNALWLVETQAAETIGLIAPYVTGEVRETLRPHSGGIIDAQDAHSRQYAAEQAEAERQRRSGIKQIQERLLTRTVLKEALQDLLELTKDHWPEVPERFKEWLSHQTSAVVTECDLEHRLEWKGNSLWQPQVLPLLMLLIDRYELQLEPDEPLAFAAMGMEGEIITRYFRRFGLSEQATGTVERLLARPPSPQAAEKLLRFVTSSGFWSDGTAPALRMIAQTPEFSNIARETALDILAIHGEPDEFFSSLEHDREPSVAQSSFGILIERQHRATVERALGRLEENEVSLRSGEVEVPWDSPLSWITKIRDRFAWEKLRTLRAKALRLGLFRVCELITQTMANIDRNGVATLIRSQLALAPPGWRHHLQARAIEHEQVARIEQVQRTPFDMVLRKIRGATSAAKLLVVCEGSTDEPVFKELISQIPDAPDVLFDFVGGWEGLRNKDPQLFLRGAQEAIVVMDGDKGRKLHKPNRPLTDDGRRQEKRLRDAGVELRVLQRYGIENYFTPTALERVVGEDLSSFLPIPDDVPVTEHLAFGTRTFSYRLRAFAASILNLQKPAPTRRLYIKSRNKEVAPLLSLEQDLSGTDLHEIIHYIATKASALMHHQ